MASTSEFLRQAEKAAEFAATQAGDQLLAEVHSFIPIFTGALRDSHQIKGIRGGAEIRSRLPYARYQYFEPLDHPVRGGELIRMTEHTPATTVGRGDKSRYGSSYRQAKKANTLTNLKAEWFSTDKVNDATVKRRVSLRFTNAFMSRLA